MTDLPHIGFLGAGLMGHGMAKNLVEAGYPLSVLAHRNREPIEDLIGRGAKEAKDVADIAASCDVAYLCLPGSPQVEAAVDQILAANGRVKTIIDTSTSNPVSTRQLAERCEAAGVTLVDAPLSRTPKEAWEGQLDVMVGASEAVFAEVKPILDVVGGRVVRVGEIGAGHTMKLLNNFLSLGYAALYSEALAIGAKNGITPDVFHSVISGGRMDCGFYQTFMDYVVGGNPNAHKFTLRNAHKDMRYLVSLANESGIASHVSSAVKNEFAVAESLGRGDGYLPTLSDIVAGMNAVPGKKL